MRVSSIGYLKASGLELIWFLSGVSFGLTASFVSGHRRDLVFLVLAIIWSALSLASEPIPDANGWRFVLSYAQVPLGFSLGYFIWRTKHVKVSYAQNT